MVFISTTTTTNKKKHAHLFSPLNNQKKRDFYFVSDSFIERHKQATAFIPRYFLFVHICWPFSMLEFGLGNQYQQRLN